MYSLSIVLDTVALEVDFVELNQNVPASRSRTMALTVPARDEDCTTSYGTGATLKKSVFPVGTHRIWLRAYDSNEQHAEVPTEIEIVE